VGQRVARAKNAARASCACSASCSKTGRADTEEKQKNSTLSIIVNESDRLKRADRKTCSTSPRSNADRRPYEFSPGRLAGGGRPARWRRAACAPERDGVALELALEDVPELLLDERAVEIAGDQPGRQTRSNMRRRAKRISVLVRARFRWRRKVRVTDQGPGHRARRSQNASSSASWRGKSAKGKQVARLRHRPCRSSSTSPKPTAASIRVEDALPHGAVFTLRLTRRAS